MAALDYEIAPEEVKAKLDRGDEFTLIDVREPWEFERSFINGAKLMPMGDVPARAHQELDPEEHIVVICHHGVRSMNVTAWLRQQGFERRNPCAEASTRGRARWIRRCRRIRGSESTGLAAPPARFGMTTGQEFSLLVDLRLKGSNEKRTHRIKN